MTKYIRLINRLLKTQLSTDICSERIDTGSTAKPQTKLDFITLVGGPTATALYEAAK